MVSEVGPAAGPRLHRLFTWFDPEATAVVTVLLGLFQVLLSVPLAFADETLPRLYILPLVLGLIIVAAGSFTMASERNPSKLLLQGCVCSNVAGLLGATLAFCLYSYNLSIVPKDLCEHTEGGYRPSYFRCPGDILSGYCWSLTLLLLLYDTVAVVLHCLLSVSALKALKRD
ncbi:uncharacterized protein si:dkey-9i23.16 isoform X2 [Dicentrarchus labrax]|uniref:uncharacterized protein si:dkey-9i23.16 isoform X2 n=1 Tax=Dicentrarchus labrax TaxID=13489 RepID=UPI0021F60F20|nr:uncharacterized protein si:dkey-9i23.16 isoform X2 [Dicentrarchus labrax]